jgi:alpha-1,2-mannosyltransferase
MALAGPGLRRVSGAGPSSRQRAWALPVAALVCALALAGYLAGVAVQHPGQMLSWYDLTVYKDAGLIARRAPNRLYTWELYRGIKFTYTPFAALVFAACSLLPYAVLRWLMTVTSLAALAVTLWLTLGALGWRGRQRATLLAGVAAVSLWTEPVQRALHLGQVELLLMALIVWDMCQPDDRWWKGAGVGVAAGIKLVPLIFIPYLVLAGKLRQAAAVTAAFLGTAVIGFVFLPHTSANYWLTGYFLHANNVGQPSSPLNQSLLGLIARAMRHATPVWLGLSVLIGVLGLVVAALLDRAGRTVAGWLTCVLTGLLCSPISWDQHWVWVVPAIALFADAALRARGAVRWAWWGLAVVTAALLGAWGSLPLYYVIHSVPGSLQPVSSNLFVEVGLGLLAVAVGAAWRARHAAGGRPASQELGRSMTRT